MGFFSWECKECGHPILSEYATNSVNDWMRQAVCITEADELIMGEYDGYGRIDDVDLSEECVGEPCLYHKACWEKAGSPDEHTGPSNYARDQGYFFNDEHDMPEPVFSFGED